jgi:hypothetical protein
MPRLRAIREQMPETPLQARRRAYHWLCEQIAMRGGKVVSRYANVLRFECMPNSALPGWIGHQFKVRPVADHVYEFTAFDGQDS